MSAETFPQQFRHLALERDSRALPKARLKKSWVLDIAGPFCLYPRRRITRNRQAVQIADMVSSLLCLPVEARVAGGVVWITMTQPNTPL